MNCEECLPRTIFKQMLMKPQEPTYLFECQINEEGIEEVRLQGWDIAFQRELIDRDGSPTSLYNVLFLMLEIFD